MNVSRSFAIVGSLFLILGISIGIYMGGSGDHTLAPLHAHINLLGFTLMMIFALVYRAVPDMAAGMLASLHFWLHSIGAAVMLFMLYLLFSGSIAEDSGLMILMPLTEIAVLLGILIFAWNLFQNFR